MNTEFDSTADRVVIIGGGPGGYEAALVAAQLGADVMLIEANRCGGSAVLTDVVPSKSLIATAEMMDEIERSGGLGIRIENAEDTASDDRRVTADLEAVNKRILSLADAQANDIYEGLIRAGVKVIHGRATLAGRDQVHVVESGGTEYTLEASTILLSVGAHPRELPTAQPDGERILTWTQLYDLDELPEHLIVVGSGVTGAEFASAYRAVGTEVTLVSSREKVLPGQDEDAADVLEFVFRNKGMNVLSRSRAASVTRTDDGVEVVLADGRRVEGSHCLMAVGSIPNTEGLGLEKAGVRVSESGHIVVDGVSRTSRAGIYAAGDCTGVLPLASVAAMQGRIAMNHALGDAVQPLKLRNVASNVFTAPEIATVGFTQQNYRENPTDIDTVMLPLDTNPRAKMLGIEDGFVKIFARRGSGSILGGVVVGPRASELILPITMAVENRLTVDQLSASFVVYPSVSGSLTEAARKLHRHL
ncbi:NAD(P)H-quinone dehydrogenase [Brevibacterium linens]|uniref:NAD(P)H dehydrogenase (quinone) n=1 Tax=Brevibacterium linens ATCC 9172 TaxID=1255617 RepID=A0A2H1JQE1_BRELN|nr:NAD(P)H-quinone dehydrogenase [Brevibacterium linens]KAB1947244.1 NAD(P)H-quinone dehydrogenase [Brevibacterium linens ATCC 9172]SMX89564.1 dihydrolipoamide dehydrogenase [Brevibacterium linens ATCC 9172]